MSIGIAKPIPSAPPETEIIEVFIPMSSPLELTRAPPEFPGLIAASVWTYRWYEYAFGEISLSVADIIPSVIVWPTPNGLPIANAISPILILSILPRVIAEDCLFIFSTAKSVSGSKPIIAVPYSFPS